MRASLSLLFFFLFLALRTVRKACLKGTVSVLFPDTNDHILWARGDDVGVYPRKTLFMFSSSWCWTPGLEGLMWGFCGRNCFIIILQFVCHPHKVWDSIVSWIRPIPPILLGFFLYGFSCSRYFLVDFSLCQWWLFCRLLWFWCLGKKVWWLCSWEEVSIGHVCSAILAALWYSYIHLDIQSLAMLPHIHIPCTPLMPFLIADLSSHGTSMWMGRLSFAHIFKSLFSSQFP